MGFFSGLLGGIGSLVSPIASIGSAITGIGAIKDGVSSLFGGDTSETTQAKKLANQQFQMQMALNQQQNEFAKENALLDYQRQRELTRDTASLQQEGKIQAGINPATSDGSTAAASVNPVAAPSAGSAPTIDVAALTNASTQRAQMFNALLSNTADIERVKEDTRGKRIQNDLDELAFNDKLDKLHNDKVISDEEYEKRKRENRIGNETELDTIKQAQEATKQAEIETRIKALQEENQKIQNDIANIVKQINEEQRKQMVFITEHQGERFAKEMAEIASRIKANNASAAASYASAAASRAQALFTEVQTKLEKAKVPFASQIAAATRDAAVNSAKLVYEQARGHKMATESAINERGYDENGKVTDNTKFVTKWFGDNIRNLVGGVLSATKAIK
uniref:Minor capsid protein n=1 Tax=Microviridae sp. ctiu24 TaxID=2826742 RepID=A0A8S5LZ01_9VIRU|nr:MAG TPA: hypothetical protein [Microviridae sp. ctiu24]